MSSKRTRCDYMIDPKDWFKAEPTWRGDSHFHDTIINFLESEDRLLLLRNGIFGKFMELGNLNASWMLWHYMLLSQVACDKKGVMSFCVQGDFVEFTPEIFGLITGLPIKSSNDVLAAAREKGGSRLLNTYFGGVDRIRMKDLKDFMETKKSEVQTDEDAVKLAEIYILGRVLLGGRGEKVIYAEHIVILEDNLDGKLQRTSSKKFKKILEEHKYVKSELAEIKRLLLENLKSDGDLKGTSPASHGSFPASTCPPFNNVPSRGDVGVELNVENALSAEKHDDLPAERGHDATVHEQFDDVDKPSYEESNLGGIDNDGDDMNCDGALAQEQSAKNIIPEQDEHVEKNISDIGVDVVGEGVNMCGALGQRDSSIEETKHCDDVDSIIRDVVSTLSEPCTSLPTSPADKNTQDEQSHDKQRNTRLCVSPVKAKRSQLKSRAYTRRKKNTKPKIALNVPPKDINVDVELNAISDNELTSIKMTQIGLDRPSSMEVEAKEVTPEKLVRQKFPGPLAKSPYVPDFDSGTSNCTFYLKYPFICNIDAFDIMSTLSKEFSMFIEDGLNKKKRSKTVYEEGKSELPECYIFGSCPVDTKNWFYTLASSNQPLNDTHMDTIFYYLRKKAKYEPNLVRRFTTTNFFFNNKLMDLYKDFEKHGQDFSVIPENHEVEKYIRGMYGDAKVAWHKVDYVLFPVYIPRGKALMGHWILGTFSFSDWRIHVYDSNRGSRNDKIVMNTMFPYQTLIPYFLERANFYVEKGIDKFEVGTLQIEMVDGLPQQTNCDCGIFVAAFAKNFIHGREIPREIDVDIIRTRYGALLWDYGRKKLQAGVKIDTAQKIERLIGKRKRECEEK